MGCEGVLEGEGVSVFFALRAAVRDPVSLLGRSVAFAVRLGVVTWMHQEDWACGDRGVT